MEKTAFLFSGQGSQYPGMGKELCEIHPECLDIYACASDVLGYDLKQLCFEGEESDLAQTRVSQPAIFATSLVALTCVRAEGIDCDAVAGHSLGEYAAMVASGMVTMEDGFRLIAARAAAMQKCAEQQDGAMFAILGSDNQTIAQACEQASGYVVPVNYNSLAQTVIAGETAAATAAAEQLAATGAKTVRLAVNAAFHSKLMQPAADEFLTTAKSVIFNQPKVDFYSNITGSKLSDVSDMPSYLARHIVSPVQFVTELQNLQADGVSRFIELGPNKVLTGLVRKTLKDVSFFQVENQKTLAKLLG